MTELLIPEPRETEDEKLGRFRAEFESFQQASARRRRGLPVRWEDARPCLDDRTESTEFDRHYIYHTGWAARVLAQTKPVRHVDLSSSLYFAAIASAFVPVDYYEYRPVALTLEKLRVNTADLCRLPFSDQSVSSLSCMHVVEHIGLGRYGDPLDPDGDLKAIRELKRVLAPGGSLLFVAPVGRARVQFNAHRVYGFNQVIDYFDSLELQEFALVPDRRYGLGLVMNPDRQFVDAQQYGCGCFWFRRPA